MAEKVDGMKIVWRKTKYNYTFCLFCREKKISTSGRRKNHFTSLTIHDLPIYTHFFALLVWCRARPWEIIISVCQINQKKKKLMLPGLFLTIFVGTWWKKKKKRSSKNYFIFIFIYLFRAKIIKIDWTKLANALESF